MKRREDSTHMPRWMNCASYGILFLCVRLYCSSFDFVFLTIMMRARQKSYVDKMRAPQYIHFHLY